MGDQLHVADVDCGEVFGEVLVGSGFDRRRSVKRELAQLVGDVRVQFDEHDIFVLAESLNQAVWWNATHERCVRAAVF